MPYKRENGVYYSDFESKSGKRIRKSLRTDSLNEAKLAEAKLIEQDSLVQINSDRKSWREAAARYFNEVQNRASVGDIQRNLRYLDKYLGDKFLDQISDDLVEDIIAAKSSEGVKGATVNRLMTTFTSVMRKACFRYRWITSIPYVRKLEESKGRLRYLTPDEAKLLIEHSAEHLKPIVTFALHTGLRRSNVLKLKWENVDLERGVCWILGPEHKNRKARSVPLNSVALGVLEKLHIYKDSEFVFLYRGKPVGKVTKSFNQACKRAGLEDVTFHTLRHTYCSWLAQRNVSTRVLKELGGWSDISMAQRYSHFSDDDLRDYQELLVDMTQSMSQSPSPKLKLVSG